jgi:four helix bundle protein
LPSYRDLEVYQEAYALGLEMHRLTLGFPEVERYVLADQMRRASKSVPANVAEGYGLATKRNFAHFVGQALGSTNEMQVHLDFAKDLGYISAEQRWLAQPLHGAGQATVSSDAIAAGHGTAVTPSN